MVMKNSPPKASKFSFNISPKYFQLVLTINYLIM
jgi:hypothetical protein